MESYEVACQALQALAKRNPGSLGGYHLHMVFAILIPMGWLPCHTVSWYPIAAQAGTIQGLRQVYGSALPASRALDALKQLFQQLREAGRRAGAEAGGEERKTAEEGQ